MMMDLDDPGIRKTIHWNHEPQEQRDAIGTLLSVTCTRCIQVWPCEPIRLLRKWDERHPYMEEVEERRGRY